LEGGIVPAEIDENNERRDRLRNRKRISHAKTHIPQKPIGIEISRTPTRSQIKVPSTKTIRKWQTTRDRANFATKANHSCSSIVPQALPDGDSTCNTDMIVTYVQCF
jgi:hypothetical protein